MGQELGRPQLREQTLPPPTLPAVLELAAFPHVYVMASGLYGWSRDPYPYLDLTGVVQALYESFGAQRLFWASDFPWILGQPGYSALLDVLDVHLPQLTASERADLLGGTAARIFTRSWGR